MKWVLAQAIMFGLLLFVRMEKDFQLQDPWLLVTQFISLIGFVILFKAVHDLRKSLSVAPEPIAGGVLQTSGIYGYIRHPMYVSVWLIMFGVVMRSGSYEKLALYPVMVAFFVLKVRHEEQLLIKKYASYKKYMNKVGAYIPKL